MTLEQFGISYLHLVAGVMVVMVAVVAGCVGTESYRSSEKAAAYKAYTECLHETKGQPVDVIQSFCGRIRDQL